MHANNGYIIAAYAVMWITVVAYLIQLGRTRSRAERRYEEVRKASGGSV